ncbi:ATP-binding cassette domain-containing protein [Oceanobacter mangrovi]|uniref:ATP-binding cassette domain-containing protein n=1 Tax=Oceanobacter mangrovi TaxID=2862510 RepID=UPI001C8E8E10|nr:ATP-binding cassette domain-containing protein [Oceanobacter mangrovi]
MKSPLIEVADLSIQSAGQTITEALSLTLQAGVPLTILGETGSGKSLLAQAIMGLLPDGLSCQGSIRIDGQLLGTSERQSLWGTRMTLLPQEPWHALDPTMRAAQQVVEVHRLVNRHSAARSRQLGQQQLTALGLQPASQQLPSQLSGGMAQRLAFAAATAAGATIILADEPTKGLDASRRDQLVRLLQQHIEQSSSDNPRGLLTITHDIEVARQLGGQIMVMKAGQLLESGPAEQLLVNPRSSYTRALIDAHPANWPVEQSRPTGLAAEADKTPLLQLRQASLRRSDKWLFQQLDLTLAAGEIIGLCGDSGSGKSSLADVLLELLPLNSGQLSWSASVPRQQRLKLYQDPPASFAEQLPLGQLLDDVIRLHRLNASRLPAMLESLALDPSLLQRPSSEVSGGELQRIALLRALLLQPRLLIADEPTSRLDPISARDVTLLMVRTLRRYQCASVLISHDEEQLRHSCDRVLKLANGTLCTLA